MPIALIYVPVLAWIILPLNFQLTLSLTFVYSPWRLHIFCLSLISAITFVAILFMPESPEFLLALGKKDEALSVLKRVYEYNTGKDREVRILTS